MPFEEINESFLKSSLSQSFDYLKFVDYIATFHSTAIEGATLSEIETGLFLENNLSIQGKPMHHHDMVRDYYHALQYIKTLSLKTESSIDLLKEVNKRIMKNTGSIVNTVLGNIDT